MVDSRDFALQKHGGQMYGDKPYSSHLIHVGNILKVHGFSSQFWQDCAWLHDTMEDTDTHYQEVIDSFGLNVYRTVWACTGKGANRKEKQADIKRKLHLFPLACTVKAADRIANVTTSLDTNNKYKFQMYYKENEDFMSAVSSYITDGMSNHITTLMNQGTKLL